MSRLKKIIIIILIIVIILIITLLGLIFVNRGEVIYEIDETGSDDEVYNIDSSIKKIVGRNDFYVVKTCVQKFYNYYTYVFDNENDVYGIDIEEISEDEIKTNKINLYNLFDERYIEYKGLTVNNISEKLSAIKNSIININNVYVSQKTENIYIYIVQGRLREVSTGKIYDFEIMLNIDSNNETFTVFLDDYINENYSNLKLGGEIDFTIDEETIKDNGSNIYDYEIIDDETYILDLFSKYKEEVLFDTETAYNHLDEEYKNKRFGSFESFKSFAKENISNNVKMKVAKYQINRYDNYTEYVCIDQNGEYYIFNENSVNNYSMILDTYTIDLPEFISKYNSAEEQVKVGMNIEKIISAVNSHDYSYVYNKLDETFRNNNFSNINSFIQFIENNFFDTNNVSYNEFKNLGGVYTYNLDISNKENSDEIKNISIIVKLLENREFVISFGIN